MNTCKRNIRAMVLLAPSLLLNPSITQGATLTVFTEPPGAYINEIGSTVLHGPAPLKVHLDLDKLAKTSMGYDGCVYIKGYTAKWPNGTEKSTGNLRVCLNGGTEYSFLIKFNTQQSDQIVNRYMKGYRSPASETVRMAHNLRRDRQQAEAARAEFRARQRRQVNPTGQYATATHEVNNLRRDRQQAEAARAEFRA
ncbi:hypothetical protein ACFL17_09815, partial [Pseudomonadota bacterium]